MKLRISNDLSLPLNAVTQVMAFLGRRGNGKSYAAQKLCELMLDAHAQVVALDPVGNWYGLRIAADGKSKGFSIPVFGGLHGDVPIESHAGALIADLIVDRDLSAVIDVSQFILSEQTRFAYDFATRLFQRKKEKPSAIHVFIEECQEFVPQNIFKGDAFGAKMLHSFERMVKLGRNFGIGASLISQRPQEINKKVLNQAECLFVFQMNGKHERDAIRDWVRTKGMDEYFVDTLPSLQRGQPYVWSPQWLETFAIYPIAEKKTYDASATPEVGAKAVTPKELSPVDVEQIRQAMAATIEKAKQDDPKELRKQVAEKERKIKELEKQLSQREPEIKIIEVPVLNNGQLSNFQEAIDRLNLLSAEFKSEISKVVAHNQKPVARVPVQPVRAVAPVRETPRAARIERPARPSTDNGPLPQGEKKVLTVLAQYPDGATRQQISILTGYKRSTRDAYIQRLGEKGYAQAEGGLVFATEEGVTALGSDYEPLPTGDALQSYWLGRLPEGERTIFGILLGAHPRAIKREEIDGLTNYARSTRDAYIQRLSTKRIIETVGRGELRASDELFD